MPSTKFFDPLPRAEAQFRPAPTMVCIFLSWDLGARTGEGVHMQISVERSALRDYIV